MVIILLIFFFILLKLFFPFNLTLQSKIFGCPLIYIYFNFHLHSFNYSFFYFRSFYVIDFFSDFIIQCLICWGLDFIIIFYYLWCFQSNDPGHGFKKLKRINIFLGHFHLQFHCLILIFLEKYCLCGFLQFLFYRVMLVL